MNKSGWAKSKSKAKKKRVYYSMLEGLFSNTNKDKFYLVFLLSWKPKKWSYNATEYKILILVAYPKTLASKDTFAWQS